MRLQLNGMRAVLTLLSVSAVLLAGRSAWAQAGSVDLRSSVYQDSDHTFISTSTAAARGNATDALEVKARYLIDVVSSASIDVVSAATDAFQENRHEGEGALSYSDSQRALGASYIYSREADWQSHTVALGGSHDLLNHNLTIAAGGAYGSNAVGRAKDFNFAESLTTLSGSLSLTAVLGPRDLLNTTYAFSALDGYQASPYRFAYFREPGDTGRLISTPEVHPEARRRHALSMRWNRHVGADSALRSSLRAYADDWGVRSLTAGLEYVIGLGNWDLGLRVRGYGQTGADFYQSVYDTPRRFMSADRELSPFIDVFGGVRARWRRPSSGVFEDLRAEFKVEGFTFLFYDFPRLPVRTGIIGELALGVSF